MPTTGLTSNRPSLFPDRRAGGRPRIRPATPTASHRAPVDVRVPKNSGNGGPPDRTNDKSTTRSFVLLVALVGSVTLPIHWRNKSPSVSLVLLSMSLLLLLP